ncbi:glycosyltransferase [Microcoleus sp. FACHB-1515]|uniref:glycosyltransferase n=1 Tax=Cyanophyceae TaxID=3028117 RepID=UPI001686D840|nr:glycosyltransferase [Microcoleus sp. FACHB-1515]MBD2089200.1 glycosyltransferase [Microcoleus sp. FACHB-1515]
MQVAFVAGTYQPDRCGVAHYTACLRHQLQAIAVESIVLTTTELLNSTADPTVKPVVQGWRLRDLPALVRSIHMSNADLLHIQHAAGTYGFERAIFLLPLLLRLSGWRKPIVTTVHEYGWWEWQPKGIPLQLIESLKQWGQKRGWWDREDGFLLTGSEAIVTTNAEAETVLLDRLPALQPRLHRISIAANVEVAPIDRSTARRSIRQKCGWPEEAEVVAFFGFLHPVKGLEILLNAFAEIAPQQPQARLLLIGGVESLALRGVEAAAYWDKLAAIVSDLDLGDRVHLTGYLPAAEASHCLSGSDIGVLPFHHGVTLKSGSLLALLAHHLPTIATVSTTPDPNLAANVVRQIPTRDRSALAAALLELLTNRALRSQLAQQGAAFVEPFGWPSIGQQHRDIYLRCLNNSAQLQRDRAIVETSDLLKL